MPTKCFQLYLCDERCSPQSMCPDNASPLFPDNRRGRKALLRFILQQWQDGAFEIAEGESNTLEQHILNGNPVDANALLICAVILEWEII